ncbi:MAG TPA: HAMP domain-containing sensor histidine kinase [Candidatus Limnocylindria bacterium]|nr:HAMP domain-containing sensor histidine kinase [Candidatus Limnocylindria bacterium]
MRGIRTRLALALVALVAVTVTAIGVGTYLFVDARLRDGLLADAQRQAQFNLSILVPDALPNGMTRDSYAASGLRDAFRLRGDVETIADFEDGLPPDVSRLTLLDDLDLLPDDFRDLVGAGRLAYAWQPIDEEPSLVVGGRPAGGPSFYFVFPARTIDAALVQLRFGLIGAALIAIVLALGMARIVARGILRPVDSGSAAAARIAAGDLSARVPVGGGADEFARFAAEFNRMADSLASTVTRLEASESQNRRFVADVSHELRTPLTALVAEASVIEAGLAGLAPDARRAGELLVADVRRLRVLVEDLMELSRFDARSELAELEPLDLGGAVRSIVESRLPTAGLTLPPQPITVTADVRRLDRIVGNLLDNARLHAPDAPVSVEVIAGAGGSTASVTVADRGPGVPPAAIRHLFDRFYKADASRTSGSSGLGLAIAAEHAALLGGDLSAVNREGGGLAVTLRLPVTRSLPPGDRPETSAAEAGERTDADSAPAAPARPTR